MRDVQVVTPRDMGRGLEWDEPSSSFEAKVMFNNNAAVVDLGTNGMQLMFREVINSDKPMLVTGVFIRGKWYGDSPDDSLAINPFTGETMVVDNSSDQPVQLGN